MKKFRRKTDDEFVDELREGKISMLPKAPFFLCSLLSCVFCFFVVWNSHNSKLRHDEYVKAFSKNNHPSDIVAMKVTRSKGFLKGYKDSEFFSRGLIWGCIFIINVLNLFRVSNRRESLLVKYYDKLNKNQEQPRVSTQGIMKIFKRKTDDEYVENLRSNRDIQKTCNILSSLPAGLLCVFMLLGGYADKFPHDEYIKVFSQNEHLSHEEIMEVTKNEGFLDGYKTGIFYYMGIFSGLISMLSCIILLIPRPSRQRNLLIKYHNELKKLDSERNAIV